MHRNSAKTHCPMGHPLVGDNLFVRLRDRGTRQIRECIACRRSQAMVRYWKARKAGIKVPDNHTKQAKQRAGRLYRERHKDQIRISRREWRHRNPEKCKAERIRRLYKMPFNEYKAMLEAHGYRCAVCGSPHGDWGRNSLVVDHCHATGKVRGLLCHPCNNILGFAKDSAGVLRKAADYVESYLHR